MEKEGLIHSVRVSLIRKAAREQDGRSAQTALWLAIKLLVRDRCHADGFVDWRAVEPVIEELLEDVGAVEGKDAVR